MVEVHAIFDDAREHYTAAFEKLVSSAKDHGLDLKTEIVVGHPAEQIIHRAEAGGIDMVLLGHRRTSRFAKLVAGSISERVSKYVHCPVMIVG
jgi:nucleotide-binding universal stress UspA family protein